MKKILITGANGFVGSHLVEASLGAGFNVIAGVRKGCDLTHLKSIPVRVVELDYHNSEALADQVSSEEPNYLIHVAGITAANSSEDYISGNVTLTNNLLSSIKNQTCEKFVFISSLAARGPGVHSENRPISEYGKSKLEAENLVRKSEISFSIIRPTGVYGPRDKAFLPLFKMAKKGIIIQLGRRERKLSFIHVKDLCKVVLGSLRSSEKMIYAFDGKTYSLAETNQTIKEVIGRKKYLTLPVSSSIFSFMMRLGNIIVSDLLRQNWNYPSEKVKELIADDWSVEESENRDTCIDLKTGFRDTFDYWMSKGLI